MWVVLQLPYLKEKIRESVCALPLIIVVTAPVCLILCHVCHVCVTIRVCVIIYVITFEHARAL